MADVIELNIPTRIDAAIKRLLILSESGYLPEQLKADIDMVIRAAGCWNLLEKKYPGTTQKPPPIAS